MMNGAFKYLKKHTEVLDADYPYVPKKNKCHEKTAEHTTVKVTGYKNVKSNVAAIKAALAVQPIAIGVRAGQDSFRMYSGGIMQDCSASGLDHGILLAGWGVDEVSGEEYWLV